MTAIRRGQRRCCPPPVWPSAQPGPPAPSYSRLGRRHYSESVKLQPAQGCKYCISSNRISWNIRQLEHSQCISFFLLKYWRSVDFVPKYSTLKFLAGEGRSRYEGELTVLPCSTFTYVLTVAFSARKTLDIQGRLGSFLPSDSAEYNLDILTE